MDIWRAALVAALIVFSPAAAAAQEFATPAAEGKQDVAPLADTHWTGDFTWEGEATRAWTAWFRTDGVFVYAYGGQTYDNGRWGERENLVWIDTNDHFAMFVGRRINGGLEGVSFNKNALQGAWRLQPD